MLSDLANALQGRKTYVLSGLGIVIALLGHFFGPTSLVGIQIPAFSWNEVWQAVYTSGLFAALRAGVNTKGA